MGHGPRLLVTAALAALAVARPARADWEVHRDGTRALRDRAEAALDAQPDDAALARRLVQLAGRRDAARLKERFAGRAAGSARYAPRAAYAQLLLALGDGPAAAEAFAAALAVSPDEPAALAGRARALALSGSPEAVAAYDQAIRHEPQSAARRRLCEAALALLPTDAHGADLERVVAFRRELARLAPDSDREAERLADALGEAGRPAEAAAVLEQRITTGQEVAKLPLLLRAARLRLRDHDPKDAARAADTLAAVLRDIPAGATDRRREVWACAWEVARAQGAEGALAEALAIRPGPAEWEILGQIRTELGDLEGGAAATARAEALAPRDAAVGRRLLALLDRLGRDDEALAAAARIARRFPSEIGFQTGLAERQWRRGDRAAAGATFDGALRRFAREPAALEGLAEAAARWDDVARAHAAWTRLVRIDPGSEVAVVGLGEAEFQTGHHEAARRTWATLGKRAGSPAAGHLRLGEVLAEHELLDDALAEARRAATSDPARAAPHRLVAQIAERQHKLDDAVAAWRRVLALARDTEPEGPALRREARARLLGLYARQGRASLDAEVRRLREEVRARPDDTETALFLAEAEQRLGDATAAAATLRAIAARGAGSSNAGARAAAVEAGFALARILRQTGQLEEAAQHLAELARLAPGRARDAELQLADIALARADVPGALAHAAAAASGADAAQLARVAEIRERAGDDALALETYRQAVAREPTPRAAMALARLLENRGDAAGAAAAAEALLVGAADDAALADAARRALDLDEALGRLPELAVALASGDPVTETPARRRALVDVLARLVPTLARDPAGDETRARLGRLALRPLVDLVVSTEVPDRRAIELLGLLGNRDAAPALVRAATPRAGRTEAVGVRGAPTSIGGGAGLFGPHGGVTPAPTETRLLALIALARLGDERGLAALTEAAAAGSPQIRVVGLWGLGRLPSASVTPILRSALRDPRPEIVALACLGLSRHADGASLATLARLGGDVSQPGEVRRAAALALGRAGGPGAAVTLLEILDRGDAELARAAAVALAWTRDPRALAPLLARALVPAAFALDDAQAPLAGLGVWQAGTPPPDEARASVAGPGLDVESILSAFGEGPPPRDLTPLWGSHVGEIDTILGEALSRGGSARRGALEAIDSRADGPGLGALAPTGATPLTAEAATAAREIAWPLADRIAATLDDPDRRIQAIALRVLAKLDDERVTPSRLAEAVGDGAAMLGAAAVTAAELLVRVRPDRAPAIVAAVGPLACDGAVAWATRLTAVELLGRLGPSARATLDRAAADPNAVVRGAALAALQGLRRSG